ncbi:hypothetical protein NCC78_04005 [Micromonospora phytophila]|uniref:hypothetical protein n=1 Tax=Micromonospora phytophila TaxID=709888 RepID=UPI00202EAF8F|nr:hypothetical protein [Micromonospora phytophila]MCM0673871.1 hypothetical protein [Micromonospora phytophila]
MEYRNYTADGTYWTVRKSRSVYWVVRLKRVGGSYVVQEWWGGYKQAGSAGGAAAQLAYHQAREDVVNEMRGSLHKALERVGLGALPKPAPVRPDPSMLPPADELDDAED